MEIPFVQRWITQHDRTRWGLDEADILQNMDRFLRSRSFVNQLVGKEVLTHNNLAEVVDWLEKRGALGNEKEHLRGAMRERFDWRPVKRIGVRYCVYGHTHAFEHRPLSVDKEGGEKIYMNSGTWRARVDYTEDKRSFVDTRVMTYLVFYAEDEDPAPGQRDAFKGVSYEVWSGLRLRRVRDS